MSWRTGSTLFIEMWPLIQARIPERDERIDFTASLLRIFAEADMDTWEVEDVHPDIRSALRKSGIGLSEPERYTNDADAHIDRDDDT
jgi:hypothetical protein